MDKLESLVSKDLAVNLVLLDQPVKLDLKVLLENLVPEATRVIRETPVKVVWTVPLDLQVPKDQLVPLANEDLLVFLVNVVILVVVEKMEKEAHWVPVVTLVSWVNPVQLVHEVLAVNLVTPVQWV